MQIALTLTPTEMLIRLHRLRWCAVAAALLIIGVEHFLLAIDFAYAPLLAITLAVSVWNILVGLRLQRGWATTELEGFLHLALDTLALSALLYWGGGSTSPFVSLYLIPIAIAAAALPAGYAWSVGAIATSIYSLLLFNTLPASHIGHTEQGGFAMHVLGMWVTFIIGGLLIMTFVAGMAAAVRRRDSSLAKAREQMLRNDQITALGALAAGAAHELSTPLSTMAVIVGELRARENNDADLQLDLATLSDQLTLCSQQIDHLLGAAEQARGEGPAKLKISAWLHAITQRWRLMRPEVRLKLHLDTLANDPEVMLDDSVSQSLINLLNNAADACLENGKYEVNMTADCDQDTLKIIIEDQGKGINQADLERAGRLRFSTKPGGRGLGLILSHANLERAGGEVRLEARPAGGTRTQVSLPLAHK